MLLTILKSKIHRAVITDADLSYEGSLGIGQELLTAANILPNEQVQVVNINNGERFTTYAIVAEEPGAIVLNGAAARLGLVGDLVIIMAFAQVEVNEAKEFKPNVVLVNSKNQIINH